MGEQKEDLARLYRLFQRVPKGLDPVADTFKKHVEAEGMKLVKEATEAMEARKDKDAGALGRPDGLRFLRLGSGLLTLLHALLSCQLSVSAVMRSVIVPRLRQHFVLYEFGACADRAACHVSARACQ